ncbi:MAG: S9 family peptidase, partial [Bacteroidaceae bacterium]|nr:S9 family peptidase [Bacteroidaceae bacterium]
RMNLFVQSIDAEAQLGTPRQITFETDRSIGGYMWVDSQRIVFLKDTDGDENFQLYGVRCDGSDLRGYTNFPGVRTSIIDDLEDVDGQILIGLNQRNPEVFDPYRLDLETGELTLLAENPGNYQGWTTDHDGHLRIVYAIVDGVNVQMLYRDTEEEEFRPIVTTNFKEELGVVCFTPDNQLAWAMSNIGRDKTALILMDPRTGEELEQLFDHPRYDVSSVTYSRKRKKLLGAFCTGHREPIRHFFDEQARQRRETLDQLFPSMRVGVADTDKSEDHALLFVGSDRTRGAYFYYHFPTGRLAHIADIAPWIKVEDMVEMHAIRYTTSDGLLIEGYLSLPQGIQLLGDSDSPSLAPSQSPLPIIVHPHGGPWARDNWGFNSEIQFLCSRGYGVFQMNFRGSTGYGRQFLEASYKQWGLRMQDDISEGVQWLVDCGIADPQRIAIYGGSYGGYATLAGICFTPQLYRCAIDYVGVSNLFTFLNTIPPYWRPMLEMMYEQVGHPEHDAEQLAATSPALHADKIVCPLFIAQGANDPRVNKAESDQMVEALRARGIEVEYMVKDDEGHGFANQENRFDFYRAMERFLAQHL